MASSLRSDPSTRSYASTLRQSLRSACCRFEGLLLGPENKINIVPDFAVIGGPGGYRPHLALVYLFQGSTSGDSGLHWLNLGLAAGNPVPPADLRHGAVLYVPIFAGAELEEEEPVYILQSSLNKLSIVAELTGVGSGNLIPVASLGLLLCAAISTGKILEVGVTDDDSEHFCHLPGGASK